MRKLIPNINDLKTEYPDIAKEWDTNQNDGLLPSEVLSHSGKKYWWKCINGHSWQATPSNRVYGYGCPYCSGRRPIRGYNDLATTSPELLREWNYEKNLPDTPETISGKSNRVFWWKCKQGHEWQTDVAHRTNRGDGCPYCSGHRVLQGFNDLASINPATASEWNYQKNGVLLPTQITISSNKKVWWVCENGHEWQDTPSNRSRGDRCPYCSGHRVWEGYNDLATTNPILAREWHPTKNGSLTPKDVTANSEKTVWWLCPICGNEWKAKPASRNSKGTGCPKCGKRNKTSFPEQAIFYYIKKHFADAVNSYTDLFNNGMELDIFIPSKRIGIEYDGYRHKDKKADAVKYQICLDNQIFLIRVSDIERENINSLCDKFILSNYTRPNEGGFDSTLKELFAVLGLKDIDCNIKRDRMKIYEQYLTRLKKNTLLEKYPDIASEWHPYKNGSLLPEMFNWGAGEKVWWKCRCGYEWEATIANRTCNGVGCPRCGRLKTKNGQINAKLQGGKNSLFAVHPELEPEWYYEKNIGIDVNMITPHCNDKAWWKCSKGHEWEAIISSRAYGTGCPYCSGNLVISGSTDLATLRPEVAALWNYEKNGKLSPEQFSPYSNKKVWWICNKGHEWTTSINSLSNGRRCPYCAGKKVLLGFNDLEHLRPDLMREWIYEKNEIKPSEVTEHSGKKAWWKCSKGHEWYAVIDSRSKGHGCPICARERVKNKQKNETNP